MAMFNNKLLVYQWVCEWDLAMTYRDFLTGFNMWVCLKIGYIPNEIAIFHRDNDQQNHWV